jgi:hypothetical protein
VFDRRAGDEKGKKVVNKTILKICFFFPGTKGSKKLNKVLCCTSAYCSPE